MTPGEQHALNVLQAAVIGDWQDMLHWTAKEGEAPKPWVNTSDWFALACADGVEIDVGELPAVLECIRETMGPDHMETLYGPLLWACRRQKMAPHPRCVEWMPERLRPLFAECGR